jgi:predicted glycogen debranching enzyme
MALIPNLFPEGERAGLYHTADARCGSSTPSIATPRARRSIARDEIVPVLLEIIERHLEGTRFGIGVDPADGLLRQGEPSYQLTWMDAKVGDWVVTPRRGKAVEINALWYKRAFMSPPTSSTRTATRPPLRCAARQRLRRAPRSTALLEPAVGHLYDVIDGEHGDDAACRPNQILAISLAAADSRSRALDVRP